MSTTPDKPGWWRLHVEWGHTDGSYRPREFIVEIDDAKWGKLCRLRDEARRDTVDNKRDNICGIHQSAIATTYETCARLLGRKLPPWTPGKEAK